MNLYYSIILSTPSRSALDAKKRKEAKGERGQRKPAKGREPSLPILRNKNRKGNTDKRIKFSY